MFLKKTGSEGKKRVEVSASCVKIIWPLFGHDVPWLGEWGWEGVRILCCTLAVSGLLRWLLIIGTGGSAKKLCSYLAIAEMHRTTFSFGYIQVKYVEPRCVNYRSELRCTAVVAFLPNFPPFKLPSPRVPLLHIFSLCRSVINAQAKLKHSLQLHQGAVNILGRSKRIARRGQ